MDGHCYSSFTEQEFGEIGCLAISQTEQLRECDTRLMARTKARARKLELAFLLACAKKNAVFKY